MDLRPSLSGSSLSGFSLSGSSFSRFLFTHNFSCKFLCNWRTLLIYLFGFFHCFALFSIELAVAIQIELSDLFRIEGSFSATSLASSSSSTFLFLSFYLSHSPLSLYFFLSFILFWFAAWKTLQIQSQIPKEYKFCQHFWNIPYLLTNHNHAILYFPETVSIFI